MFGKSNKASGQNNNINTITTNKPFIKYLSRLQERKRELHWLSTWIVLLHMNINYVLVNNNRSKTIRLQQTQDRNKNEIKITWAQRQLIGHLQ